MREIRDTAAGSVTTHMVHPDNQGGLLFEHEVSSSGTRYRHHINGGSGVAAVYTTGAETKTEYWHKDHLGSVAVMTDVNGVEISGTRRAYDPWGKSSVEADDYRGFTGHEHFDGFGIIHMNGRIYDPKLQFIPRLH